MTTDEQLTDDDVALVEALAKILDQQAHLEAQARDIKNELRATLGTGTFAGKDGVDRVSIRPNRRFAREQAAKVLPPELLALCTVTTVDSAQARKTLPPAVYETCMTDVGDPVVRVL